MNYNKTETAVKWTITKQNPGSNELLQNRNRGKTNYNKTETAVKWTITKQNPGSNEL